MKLLRHSKSVKPVPETYAASSHFGKHDRPCGMKFSRELISRILDFKSFAGTKFREFAFQTLLLVIIFRGFHVRYLKVITKTEAIW